MERDCGAVRLLVRDPTAGHKIGFGRIKSSRSYSTERAELLGGRMI